MAEKEQIMRHETQKNSNLVISKNHQHWREKEKLGMILAFLVLISGMCFSYFLISKDHSVLGTVFAGASLIAGASLFMGKTPEKKQVVKPEN
jgi:uncharacterized membrane protein